MAPLVCNYFEHGYRAAGELKGNLDENQKYYKASRGKNLNFLSGHYVLQDRA